MNYTVIVAEDEELLLNNDDIIFRYGNTADGHGIVSIGRYFQTDAEE